MQKISSAFQDENRMGAPIGIKAAAAPGVVPPKRSAFGDISNQGLADRAVLGGAKKAVVAPALAPAAAPMHAPSVLAPVQAAGRVVTRSMAQQPAPIEAAVPATPAHMQDDEVMVGLTLSPRIDAVDESNAQACSEYVKDIYDYFQRIEGRDMPSATYMSRQTDINEKMRSILVDWLVDVHHKFKLLPETLFLTINIIDRFLACKLVSRQKLQLVGVAAMLVASKYEEIYAPEVRDFVYISAKAYTREDILRMERLILATLNFNLTTPTAFPFIKRFQKACDAAPELESMANFIIETSLLHYNMIGHLPSMMAASSLYLARRVLGLEGWTPELQHYTRYTEGQIKPCAMELLELIKPNDAASTKLEAVKKKYTLPKYHGVAGIPNRAALALIN